MTIISYLPKKNIIKDNKIINIKVVDTYKITNKVVWIVIT